LPTAQNRDFDAIGLFDTANKIGAVRRIADGSRCQNIQAFHIHGTGQGDKAPNRRQSLWNSVWVQATTGPQSQAQSAHRLFIK
jgi:hypothetical protein